MRYLMKTCMLICLVYLGHAAFAQPLQTARITEYRMTFPTYPFSDPNPIALLGPVYPYFRFDGFTDSAIQKQWKVVELENAYIKILLLPEIGGKIWAAIEKSKNRPFLYYNHSVKFRDIAMRGPWTSGGLEANYGIIGHTPNCATPVDYVTRTNPDGSVSCIVGVLDLLTRSNWTMEINLARDKAYFTTQSFWYNGTAIEEPYYHWMNAGLKASGNLEFVFPGTSYLGHEGEYADWPINKSNGKRISFYENNDFGGYKSYHVFGRYTDFFGAYWHNDGMGMARFSPHDEKAGKKIWIWGLSRQGMIWEKLLTDSDGQYVELQSGRLFNQSAEKSSYTPFKHKSLGPFETDSWKEYWYPVLKTEGIVKANSYGALNLKYANGWLKIYFSPVQFINDKLEVKNGNRPIYTKILHLSPLQVFADSVQIEVNPDSLRAELGNGKLQYSAQAQIDSLSRPVQSPAGFDWNSIYGLYLLGKESMDEKNYPSAELLLKEALKKDQNYLPALVKMSELYFRNLRYSEALEFAKRALSVDTYDGAANYYYGLINLQLGRRTDALDGFDIATLSTEYRGAAYAQLGRMYLGDKKFEKALLYSQKAIGYDRNNIFALELEAVALRYLGQVAKSKEILNTLTSLDALNHFAKFEKYLNEPTQANKFRFTSMIRSELPQESYIELAVWYYNAGCLKEASKLFSICPQVPETEFWLAYLGNRKVDFSGINPAFSFMFRSESADILEKLLTRQNHWILKYQLALIYKDRNRVEECKKLLASCGNEPNFAPFYAFRAAISTEQDSALKLQDLQRALALDSQWRYHKLLTEHFIHYKLYERAMGVAEAFYLNHPQHYIMGMLYAKTLLLNKRYARADSVLGQIKIIPFEGATEGREFYRESKLMLALDQMNLKDFDAALVRIDQAKQWPENLGVGKPYDQDIDTRLEDWMSYQCYVSKNETEKATIYLQKICDFTPRVENTVRNFFAANALISAWAFDKLNNHQKAIGWLDNQIRAYPEYEILPWCKSVFEGKEIPLSPAVLTDANLRIIGKMMQNTNP